jgi:serine/threonine-protein kinase HipA
VERGLHVFIDLSGETVFLGRLFARVKNGRESTSFTYDDSWLKRRGAFALAPNLMLTRGTFHSPSGLFNAFADTAPDSWGRKLMRRHERGVAEKERRAPRTLFDIDFLAGVEDETRLGALRYKDPQGEGFLSRSTAPIPPFLELGPLLAATDRIGQGRETDKDVMLVLAPGTSLGGARPKATVRDKTGNLLIAKFPKRDDDWPVTVWEAVALTLARKAGITVADWRLQKISRRPVLIASRFDRQHGSRRVPFMSAITALNAADHDDQRSYLELADALRRDGAAPSQDLLQLWRRIVFNILISNTDDHLRNHGFLRAAKGWRLAPAYDLNPCPTDVKPRVHALAIDETDATGSLETALKTAKHFGIAAADAAEIAREVARSTQTWRQIAKDHGLNAAQVDRMASAFDHQDLQKSLSLSHVLAETSLRSSTVSGRSNRAKPRISAASTRSSARPKATKPKRNSNQPADRT